MQTSLQARQLVRDAVFETIKSPNLPGTDSFPHCVVFLGSCDGVLRLEWCVLPQAEEFLYLLLVKVILVVSLFKEVECLLPVQYSRPESRTGPCVPLTCSFRAVALIGVLRRAERALNSQKERSLNWSVLLECFL